MTISYPLSFPALTPNKLRWTMRNVVAQSASPFSGSQQVQRHQGAWWEVDLSFPPLGRADASLLFAFLASMRGKYGTVNFGDPTRTAPRGVGTGTPLVNGGGQTGESLVTDGWTAGQTGILKAGDFLQLGSGSSARLHVVLADANSDGSGNATFSLWPDLRTSPSDNAAIVVSSPVGVFRLGANDPGFDIEEAQLHGFAFSMMESL